jgi:hypothetical protein
VARISFLRCSHSIAKGGRTAIPCTGAQSRGTNDLNRTTRHVFMEVGENQQKLEHSVALIGVTPSRFVIQVVHYRQRVGQQPFEAERIYRLAGLATFKSLVRTRECLIQKMVQAQLFTG